MPFLENLLPAGWGKLLGLSDLETKVATAATTPHRVSVVFHGTLVEPDASRWGWASHPHLVGDLSARRVATDDPRDVSITYDHNLKHKNVDNYEPGGFEIWGPSGPHTGTWSFGGARVIREDGTVEELPPAESDDA